jgi:hypothetical protein
MDEDRLDLIRKLSTQAGMIFEDASVKALVIGGCSAEELHAVVSEVRDMAERASVMLAAAEALFEPTSAMLHE